MLVAMGGYRLFTRPAVTATAGGLSITNPTRQWRVPAELVEGTDDTLTYVRVHAGRRRIVCAGLEKSNLSMLRGDQTMDERIAKAIGEAISHGEEGDDVTWRWTRVNVSELVMLCFLGRVLCGGCRCEQSLTRFWAMVRWWALHHGRMQINGWTPIQKSDHTSATTERTTCR